MSPQEFVQLLTALGVALLLLDSVVKAESIDISEIVITILGLAISAVVAMRLVTLLVQ